MPLFDLKNAKKKLTSSSLTSLGLRKTQSTGNIEDAVIVIHKPTSESTVGILRTPNSSSQQRPPTPPPAQSDVFAVALAPVLESEDEVLATKLRDITACDMELLLSLETQARMDVQEEKERKQQEILVVKRPTRLKFEIPVTPPRSRSPDPKFFHAAQRRWSLPEDSAPQDDGKKSNRLSRWSRLIKQQQQEEAKIWKHQQQNSSDEDGGSDNGSQQGNTDSNNPNVSFPNASTIAIGSKVKLFKRPLPIVGTVKYIGKVHFESGEWLGIELDSRVGNTDGKIDGKRYFQTNLHCGIFARKEDTMLVSL